MPYVVPLAHVCRFSVSRSLAARTQARIYRVSVRDWDDWRKTGEAGSEKRGARSGEREAGSEKRGARSGEREAGSEKRGARSGEREAQLRRASADFGGQGGGRGSGGDGGPDGTLVGEWLFE